MSEFGKKTLSYILAILLVFAPVFSSTGVVSYAAEFNDLNASGVFLKQQTSVTCTLSSAAMMFRRTAICAGYDKWKDITEENIRYKGWIDGVGLRWNFTSYGMTINHGYFTKETEEIKAEVISLLKKYPQGYVIYNGGSQGQNHAVFLCDYDEKNDIFYVADPANNAPAGRIKLSESTIVGETQDEQIKNLTAYWYISDPSVEYSKGKYTADPDSIEPEQNVSQQYDPTEDVNSFDTTRTKVMDYFVVSENSASGTSLRYYPSGNSVASDTVQEGTILFLTYKGQNKSGAWWYRTISGTYIFSSNITPFDEYSKEVKEFNNTKSALKGTYAVSNSDRSQPVALRIEPSEGNNVVAYLDEGHLLYVVESGTNSAGAKWYKTEEGYYIKAAETTYVSKDKDKNAGFSGTAIVINGAYESKPVKDIIVEPNTGAMYYQIVVSSTLKVRLAPVSGQIIGYLVNGEIVKIIEVKNGWGKMIYDGVEAWISLDYAESVDINQFPVEVKSVKLSAHKIRNGETIGCTVTVADDRKYDYKFSLYNVDGKLLTSFNHSGNSNYFETSIGGTGYYYFRVDITDSLGRSAYGFSSNFAVYDPLTLDSVTCNTQGVSFTGDMIVWKAAASEVSDTSVFNYALYRDGVLLDEISSESDEFFLEPDVPGSYVLEVYMSDEFSETQKIVTDAITVYEKLIIESINLNSKTAITGSEIVCSVDVAGGTGNYLYSFAVFNDGKLISNGGFTKENEIRIQFDEEGTYKFFCTVVDSANLIVSEFSEDVNIVDLIKGDVDIDGKITAKDARLALRHSAQLDTLDEKGFAAADVNNDSKVNASDARAIIRFSAKIIDSFD